MERRAEGLGPYKTRYNRFVYWNRAGTFNRIFCELSRQDGASACLMVDATHLKSHRTGSHPPQK